MHQTIVLAHSLGALVFILAHGVSAVVLFLIRGQTHPAAVRRLLRVSQLSMMVAYLALLVLIVAGVWAAIEIQAFTSGRLWLWAAVVTLVVVMAAMYGTMTPTYGRWRVLVGDGSSPVETVELQRALRVPVPLMGAAIGLIGLLVILWLMYSKPF